MQESMSCWIPRAGSSSRRETIWNFRSSVPWEKRGNLKLLYSSTQAYFLRFLVRGSCWLEQIVTILWYQVNKMWTSSRTIHLLDCVGKNINDFFPESLPGVPVAMVFVGRTERRVLSYTGGNWAEYWHTCTFISALSHTFKRFQFQPHGILAL